MRRLIGSLVGRVPEPVVRRVGDTSAALVAYRWGMEQTLRGAKLEGVDAVIRMEVTDDDRVAAWELIVRDGIATTSAANGSEPHAVVRVDVVDWLALVSGKTSGGELLFDGRLSIEGDESKVVSLLGQLDGEHQPF
jgi:predicted lipid carrier protein YhbT